MKEYTKFSTDFETALQTWSPILPFQYTRRFQDRTTVRKHASRTSQT